MRRVLRDLLSNGLSFGINRMGASELASELHAFRELQLGPGSELVQNYHCLTSDLGRLCRLLTSPAKNAVPISIGAVGNLATNQEDWESARESDAKFLNDFIDQVESRAEIDSYTVQVLGPSQVPSAISSLSGFESVPVFIQFPSNHYELEILGSIAETDWLGVSICLDSPQEMFPFASVIAECLDLEIPFQIVGKANPWWGTPSSPLGVFSVFGAVALAWAESLTAREIELILNNSDSTLWTLQEESIEFQTWQADLNSIEECRDVLCGFSVADLRHVVTGLLHEPTN